jgi:C_GCAxxG_C_C family probable redox protein
MDRVELAVSHFQKGLSCSQALVVAYGEGFGLEREMAVRLAAGFGGGMGRMAQTCGAVTGAVMLLGLKYGSVDVEDRQAKEKTHEAVREFANRFTLLNGSLICRELLGCDISTPDGFRLAKAKKLADTVCPKFVRDAAEIIEEMLGTRSQRLS